MKKTGRAAIAATCALAALAAGGASAAAAHEWRINGVPVTSPVEIRATSTLRFRNSGEHEEWSCTVTQKGVVKAAGESEITSITGEKGEVTIPCTRLSGGCEKITTEALFLPWKSKLVTSGTELRNELIVPEHFPPKWRYVCDGENTCLDPVSEAVKNNSSGVEIIYDSKAPATNCSAENGFSISGSSTFKAYKNGSPMTLSAV